MIFELGKTYIVDVTEKGIIPSMVFDKDRWFDKDNDDLDFLTSEEKDVVINAVLDKIRAEIEKVFCMSVVTNKLRTPMEVKNEILQIIDKYRAETENEE